MSWLEVINLRNLYYMKAIRTSFSHAVFHRTSVVFINSWTTLAAALGVFMYSFNAIIM